MILLVPLAFLPLLLLRDWIAWSEWTAPLVVFGVAWWFLGFEFDSPLWWIGLLAVVAWRVRAFWVPIVQAERRRRLEAERALREPVGVDVEV